jgi:peptidoglycan/LPS O-acetylase OafA/YrhL
MNSYTLDSLTSNRKNNLDALRLIGAFLVLFSHSFPIAGNNEPGPPFFRNTFGELGVYIFFIISGFLITQSYMRSNSPKIFLWARFLRIFPALIFVVFVTVFFFGPIITNLTAIEYYKNSQTYYYLSNITLYNVNYQLPGVFLANPIPSVVNGSLCDIRV